LMNGGAGRFLGEAGESARLPRRRLAHTGREHAAHEHFVDVARRRAGAPKRLDDRDLTELRCLERRQLTLEAADGRTRRTDDDDLAHDELLPRGITHGM